MSACERCWALSAGDPDEYRRLLAALPPCTPEEQAGPDAGECPVCRRRSLHQFTGECMAGCQRPRVPTDFAKLDERVSRLERMMFGREV